MTLKPREIPKLSSDLLWAVLYPKGSYTRLKGEVENREKGWSGFKGVEWCDPSHHSYLSTESLPGKTCIICSLWEEELGSESPGFFECPCSFLQEKPHNCCRVFLVSSLA